MVAIMVMIIDVLFWDQDVAETNNNGQTEEAFNNVDCFFILSLKMCKQGECVHL